jgi:hypothetical protein
MDDWNPEALPSAVTDPDEREATVEGQRQFRRDRDEHMARVEEHRGSPEADPARQGAFEQKPDIQQSQIELWAYKWLEDGGDWAQFIRIHELPEVWANTLVKPRADEIRSRRALPEEQGLFESTDVQLEGGGSAPTGATGHVQSPGSIDHGPLPSEQTIAETEPFDERGPSGNAFQLGRDTIDAANRTRAAEALGKYLERVATGEILEPDVAVIDRLERLAGL